MNSPIAKLGHVAAYTTDLEESLRFFRDVIGLHEVEREGETAYLRANRDWEHHTLSLTEADEKGIDHIAFRTTSEEALETLAADFEAAGADVRWVEAGTETGQGEAIRVERFGHPYEFYYDVEKPDAPEGKRSKLKNRVYSESLGNRITPRRIDHIHVQDGGTSSVDHADWLQDSLGYRLNERYSTNDGEPWGWWLATTALPHDIAIHREPEGTPAQFHHIAYHLDSLQDLWEAADVLAEEGIELNGGPGRHAITRADFLYVIDEASGVRLELFAGPGYLNFEPDWEPIEWTEAEIGGESSHQWIGIGPTWDGIDYKSF